MPCLYPHQPSLLPQGSSVRWPWENVTESSIHQSWSPQHQCCQKENRVWSIDIIFYLYDISTSYQNSLHSKISLPSGPLNFPHVRQSQLPEIFNIDIRSSKTSSQVYWFVDRVNPDVVNTVSWMSMVGR